MGTGSRIERLRLCRRMDDNAAQQPVGGLRHTSQLRRSPGDGDRAAARFGWCNRMRNQPYARPRWLFRRMELRRRAERSDHRFVWPCRTSCHHSAGCNGLRIDFGCVERRSSPRRIWLCRSVCRNPLRQQRFGHRVQHTHWQYSRRRANCAHRRWRRILDSVDEAYSRGRHHLRASDDKQRSSR